MKQVVTICAENNYVRFQLATAILVRPMMNVQPNSARIAYLASSTGSLYRAVANILPMLSLKIFRIGHCAQAFAVIEKALDFLHRQS